MPEEKEFSFEISLSVLNHLGRNLYRNFITVLGEAISNSWDANADNVWIQIDKDNDRFFIVDDGDGMDADDFQNKFLKIGYSKRKDKSVEIKGRPFIGAKGIGKLALLSCAEQVTIFSKTSSTDFVGGVINNSGLDEAIENDLIPQEYPLEAFDSGLLDWVSENLTIDELPKSGTVLCFEGMKDNLRNTPEYLRRLLALSFAFATIDPDFNIHLNGETISVGDLKPLSDASQFLWTLNGYSDKFIDELKSLALPKVNLSSNLQISGYIASVSTPKELKVRGKDDRATIDLFVNGRIRERNLMRRMPTARVTESYLYGQIHFDMMDEAGSKLDPFTSSREGVKEEDPNFASLIDELRREIIPKVLKGWDEMRRQIKQDGDDDAGGKTVPERRAESLYNNLSKKFVPPKDNKNHDTVAEWDKQLREEASFNVPAYIDCFISENLVRKLIDQKKLDPRSAKKTKVKEFEDAESDNLDKANISFDIRQDNNPTYYLGMDDLVDIVDPQKHHKKPGLWRTAISYKPVRNVVGHTGLLTQDAKDHLKMNLTNVAGRIRKLLSE